MVNSFDCRLGTASFQPCGFFGGSLCASSGHSLPTTARISSEMWSMRSVSSMNLCRRFKAAGIMTLSPTVRDLIDAALFVVDPYCHGSRGQPTQVTIASSHRFTAARCPLWLPTNKCLAKSNKSCTGGAPPLVTCKTTVGKLKKMRVAYDSIIKV